jgi:hypothetical protein
MLCYGSHSRNATEPLSSIALHAAIRPGESRGPGPNYPPFLPFVNNGIETRVKDSEILRAMVESALFHAPSGHTAAQTTAFLENPHQMPRRVQLASAAKPRNTGAYHGYGSGL